MNIRGKHTYKNGKAFYLNIPDNIVDFYRLDQERPYEIMLLKKPFEKIMVHIQTPKYKVIESPPEDKIIEDVHVSM